MTIKKLVPKPLYIECLELEVADAPRLLFNAIVSTYLMKADPTPEPSAQAPTADTSRCALGSPLSSFFLIVSTATPTTLYSAVATAAELLNSSRVLLCPFVTQVTAARLMQANQIVVLQRGFPMASIFRFHRAQR